MEDGFKEKLGERGLFNLLNTKGGIPRGKARKKFTSFTTNNLGGALFLLWSMRWGTYHFLKAAEGEGPCPYDVMHARREVTRINGVHSVGVMLEGTFTLRPLEGSTGASSRPPILLPALNSTASASNGSKLLFSPLLRLYAPQSFSHECWYVLNCTTALQCHYPSCHDIVTKHLW